ncbi:hypothetical protein PTTG_30446 [Puccinia triticina 1-1 BBBD Race 1]|uniref:Uncharacterized protein n=1 Tax=Puccinia triticina (isolate 1-1 / race 1 (BBBD)) TaxID=630390 RepID=A0A180FYQ6_PUCT1|nr:hypothetical protein PTTG_30446 [Puccinia triticina 1-1 BBBD Race 1]
MQQPNNPGDSSGPSSQAQGKQPIDPTTIELPENMSTKDYIQAMMAIQHTTLIQLQTAQAQAQADRNKISSHTALLEKIFIKASVKKEATSPPDTGCINLQRYRISDGPKFRGPFQDVEAFLKWIHAVEIHFETRAVSNADDRIHLVGRFIEETNLLSLYATKSESYLGKPWINFRRQLFDYALLRLWRTQLKSQILQATMTDSESFIIFSTQIRTLQRMYNFDKPADAISDFELAKWVTLGVSEELHTKIYDFGILEPEGFDLMVFEKNATTYADGISRLAAARARLLTSQARSRSPSNTSGSDFLWRLRSYFDSTGRCHFCKLHCGNYAGSCLGPLD